jgi:CYTH domain-containing protein
MAREIERKFLVVGDAWRELGAGATFRQGYLSTAEERSVRVRVTNGTGTLTIKGAAVGAVRSEYEYAIPLADANELLDSLCQRPLIEKIRYRIPFGGFVWEVDEFAGSNAGLIIAEIELAHEEESFPRPPWIGREVTGDSRYFNANLIARPYREWAAGETLASITD